MEVNNQTEIPNKNNEGIELQSFNSNSNSNDRKEVVIKDKEKTSLN